MRKIAREISFVNSMSMSANCKRATPGENYQSTHDLGIGRKICTSPLFRSPIL